MRALALFTMPMAHEADVDQVIEKACEVGYPLLGVVFEVEADLNDAPADGMTAEMVEGLRLGEMIAELEHEFGALATREIRKVHALILPSEVMA